MPVHYSSKTRWFCLWLLLICLMNCQASWAARFVDVGGNWSEKAVNSLSDKGVIAAEADGKFRPVDPITRAVLCVWLVKVLGIDNQPVSNTPSFVDVKPSDWFYKGIEIARQNNYVAGYADGFRPNQFIQRGEVISILSRTLNLPQPDDEGIAEQLARYKDGNAVPDWARVGVAEMAQANVLENNPDPTEIKAATIATRGDAAVLLARLDQYLSGKQIANATQQALTPPPTPSPNAPAYGDSYAAPPASYQPNYQGQVQQGNYAGQAQGGFAAAPPPAYGQPAGGYPGYGQQWPQGGQAAPPSYLQGQVAVISAGTRFQSTLKNSIDSGASQPGEEIQAVLSQPVYANGAEVLPAGSRINGQITNVVSAKRFKFGANGKVDIRFTSIETPDGRRFPLSGSVDTSQVRLSGGTTAGRVGKGLLTTGVGAGGGAALGTALGAIVGSTSGGRVGRATGMGAVFGTALGAGVGGVGAAVRKGSEVRLPAGTTLPIQLDESMQVTAGGAPYQQQPPPPHGGNYPTPYSPPSGQPYYSTPR